MLFCFVYKIGMSIFKDYKKAMERFPLYFQNELRAASL